VLWKANKKTIFTEHGRSKWRSTNPRIFRWNQKRMYRVLSGAKEAVCIENVVTATISDGGFFAECIQAHGIMVWQGGHDKNWAQHQKYRVVSLLWFAQLHSRTIAFPMRVLVLYLRITAYPPPCFSNYLKFSGTNWTQFFLGFVNKNKQ